MKRLLLFSVVLFMTLQTTKAQMWCNAGATWHYTFNGGMIDGFYKLYYSGDTTIASQPCKIITKEITALNIFTNTYQTAVFGEEYVYEDSDKLYFWRQGAFRTLFDFSAEVGDTLDVWGTNNWNDVTTGEPCDSTGKVRVDTVGTVNINGQNLRYYSVSPVTGSKWGWEARIVEKIGPYIDYDMSSTCYLFPIRYDFCGMIPDMVNEGGPFRCYEEMGSFGLFTNYEHSCDYTLSDAGIENETKLFEVYPNPASEQISISPGDVNMNYTITITDVSGKQVQNIVNVQGNKNISLAGMENSIYFITVSGNNMQHTKKLVIQD